MNVPEIISRLENKIWNEIIDIANGTQSVYDAASRIVLSIPENFDHIDAETCDWFMLRK